MKSRTLSWSSFLSIMTHLSSFLCGISSIRPCLWYLYFPFHHDVLSCQLNFCMNLFIVPWSVFSGNWNSIMTPFIMWSSSHNYSNLFLIVLHDDEEFRKLIDLVKSVRDRSFPYDKGNEKERNWHNYDQAQLNVIVDVLDTIRDIVNDLRPLISNTFFVFKWGIFFQPPFLFIFVLLCEKHFKFRCIAMNFSVDISVVNSTYRILEYPRIMENA